MQTDIAVYLAGLVIALLLLIHTIALRANGLI